MQLASKPKTPSPCLHHKLPRQRGPTSSLFFSPSCSASRCSSNSAVVFPLISPAILFVLQVGESGYAPEPYEPHSQILLLYYSPFTSLFYHNSLTFRVYFG